MAICYNTINQLLKHPNVVLDINNYIKFNEFTFSLYHIQDFRKELEDLGMTDWFIDNTGLKIYFNRKIIFFSGTVALFEKNNILYGVELDYKVKFDKNDAFLNQMNNIIKDLLAHYGNVYRNSSKNIEFMKEEQMFVELCKEIFKKKEQIQ